MSLRRGFLLAGIHLAIGGTIVALHGSALWTHSRPLISLNSNAKYQPVVWLQEDETVTFHPCDGGFGDDYVPPAERIVQTASLPAWLLTGWGNACSSQSGLVGKLEAHYGRGSIFADAIASGVFCAAIPILWFFVGGLPLKRPQRWWGEPGAFITACTVVSVPFLLILSLALTGAARTPEEIAQMIVRLLTLLVTLGWIWWFGLLLSKIVKACWRLIGRRVIRTA
jgi:hypothetical protein